MMCKIVIFTVIFGLAVADPNPEVSSTQARNMLEIISDEPGFELSLQPEGITLILECLNALVGYKSTALAIAVNAIEWLVSHSFFIAIGSLLTFGFCKLSGLCSLNYEEYVPITHVQTLVTPERLESAEKFLVTAFEKYAEKQKRALRKSSDDIY